MTLDASSREKEQAEIQDSEDTFSQLGYTPSDKWKYRGHKARRGWLNRCNVQNFGVRSLQSLRVHELQSVVLCWRPEDCLSLLISYYAGQWAVSKRKSRAYLSQMHSRTHRQQLHYTRLRSVHECHQCNPTRRRNCTDANSTRRKSSSFSLMKHLKHTKASSYTFCLVKRALYGTSESAPAGPNSMYTYHVVCKLCRVRTTAAFVAAVNPWKHTWL